MQRTPFIACVLGLLSLAPTAHAVGQLADISIYDRDARESLPVYYHNGEYFIAGKPGNEYRIQIRNQSGGDLLSVVSVDGVNVVSGETAHWRQGGYVLGSWEATGIDGWRKSMARTAAFYFTRLPDSYAARTGRADNVGVIGVALFQRMPAPLPMPQQYDDRRWEPQRSDAEAARDSAAAPAAESAASAGLGNRAEDKIGSSRARKQDRLGTGHGRSETSHVRYTEFERATATPAEIITIRYDSREHLIAMGVIPDDRPLPIAANPFPGAFVPDPPR